MLGKLYSRARVTLSANLLHETRWEDIRRERKPRTNGFFWVVSGGFGAHSSTISPIDSLWGFNSDSLICQLSGAGSALLASGPLSTSTALSQFTRTLPIVSLPSFPSSCGLSKPSFQERLEQPHIFLNISGFHEGRTTRAASCRLQPCSHSDARGVSQIARLSELDDGLHLASAI